MTVGEEVGQCMMLCAIPQVDGDLTSSSTIDEHTSGHELSGHSILAAFPQAFVVIRTEVHIKARMCPCLFAIPHFC